MPWEEEEGCGVMSWEQGKDFFSCNLCQTELKQSYLCKFAHYVSVSVIFLFFSEFEKEMF